MVSMALNMSEVVGEETYLLKLSKDAKLRRFVFDYRAEYIDDSVLDEDLTLQITDNNLLIKNYGRNFLVVIMCGKEELDEHKMTVEQVDKMMSLIKETKPRPTNWSERLREIVEAVLE